MHAGRIATGHQHQIRADVAALAHVATRQHRGQFNPADPLRAMHALDNGRLEHTHAHLLALAQQSTIGRRTDISDSRDGGPDFEQIKQHYYVVHRDINPLGIVPQGPDLANWQTDPGRV